MSGIIIEGEWSGLVIRTTRRGFYLTTWSRVQGQITGLKLTMPYGERYPQNMALSIPWNDHMSTGEYIAYMMMEMDERNQDYRRNKDPVPHPQVRRLPNGQTVF